MSCSFNKVNSPTVKTHYKSLYLGLVECPNILQSVYNGITIKVIDAQQYYLNVNHKLNIDHLKYLPSAVAKDNDAGIDIYYATLNYLKYLTQITGRLNVINDNFLISIYNIPNLDNAYFTGQYMVYGNGKEFKPLVALDVVSHELTHGLCKSICDLEYKGISGALNESLSDVLATGFEFYMYGTHKGLLGSPDFEIGEDIVKNGKSNLRDMRIPRKVNDAQYIDHNDLKVDLGGIHLNSAIPNYLFYKCCMDIGLHELDEILSYWYRVYCHLPKDCNWVTFGRIAIEEVPFKWYNIINHNLKDIKIL